MALCLAQTNFTINVIMLANDIQLKTVSWVDSIKGHSLAIGSNGKYLCAKEGRETLHEEKCKRPIMRQSAGNKGRNWCRRCRRTQGMRQGTRDGGEVRPVRRRIRRRTEGRHVNIQEGAKRITWKKGS